MKRRNARADDARVFNLEMLTWTNEFEVILNLPRTIRSYYGKEDTPLSNFELMTGDLKFYSSYFYNWIA